MKNSQSIRVLTRLYLRISEIPFYSQPDDFYLLLENLAEFTELTHLCLSIPVTYTLTNFSILANAISLLKNLTELDLTVVPVDKRDFYSMMKLLSEKLPNQVEKVIILGPREVIMSVNEEEISQLFSDYVTLELKPVTILID